MKLRDYAGWQDLGFHVRRGAKAVGRDLTTGKALFSRDQVEETPSYDLKLNQEERESLGIGGKR